MDHELLHTEPTSTASGFANYLELSCQIMEDVTPPPHINRHGWVLKVLMCIFLLQACVDPKTKDELHMVEMEGQDAEGQKIKAVLVSLKPSSLPSVSKREFVNWCWFWFILGLGFRVSKDTWFDSDLVAMVYS